MILEQVLIFSICVFAVVLDVLLIGKLVVCLRDESVLRRELERIKDI